jgi:hypothetical protein
MKDILLVSGALACTDFMDVLRMWVHDMERNIMNGHYDMCKEKGATKIQRAQLNCELNTVKMPPKAGNLL